MLPGSQGFQKTQVDVSGAIPSFVTALLFLQAAFHPKLFLTMTGKADSTLITASPFLPLQLL